MGKCYCKKKVKKKGISMYHFFAEHNNIHDTYIDIINSARFRR